jgi:hypothetical protein
MCEAGPEMTFHFGQLIAHICKTRNVRAGSIVGSGTVSNKDWSHGYSCIAEKRAIETIEDGKPKTEFMKFGDTIRIEAKGKDGLVGVWGDRPENRRSLNSPHARSLRVTRCPPRGRCACGLAKPVPRPLLGWRSLAVCWLS